MNLPADLLAALFALAALAEVTMSAIEAPPSQRPSRWIAEACIWAGAVVETAVRALAIARVWFFDEFGGTRARLRMLSDDNTERFDLPLRSGSLPVDSPARREQNRPASAPGAFSLPPGGCA